jgi:hypothetical protein
MTMTNLIGFPNPVNEKAARTVAGGVLLLSVLTLALSAASERWLWLVGALAYGFLARVLTGPKLSPLGQLATRVVTPRLHIEHRYAPGPAKRFAQTIGAVFTVTAALLYYAAGLHTAAFALVGVIVVFASLEAFLGLCVGCKVFYLGMRLGLVPASVCEQCANVLGASRA